MLKSNSLSRSLQKRWSDYEKQVHLSRDHTSPGNIHRLRVSTQRLEAVLTFVNTLHSAHHSKNIISLIQNVRKSLGPLRDIQVESTALEMLRGQKLKRQKKHNFSDFFSGQKKKAKGKADRCLQKISLSHERKRVDKLFKKLQEIELRHNKRQIQSQLDAHMKSSILKFNKEMKNVNPERVKEIHRFRIKAKKIRYQGECLNQLTGLSRYDLPNLKIIQSVAGQIQNGSVLVSTLEHFLAKKKHQNDPKALKFKRRIQDNQKKLIENDFSNLPAIRWVK